MNAITIYRLGNWCYRRNIPVLPKVLYYLTFLLFNSSIPPSCTIGEGSRFAYGGIGVVIHARSRIGKNVMIGQNVTMGGSFGSGTPTVGDNVWVSPGVKIIGSVNVGSNVILGANAVVIRDIPDNSIAAGVPARVLRRIPKGALNASAGSLLEDPSWEADRKAGPLAANHGDHLISRCDDHPELNDHPDLSEVLA